MTSLDQLANKYPLVNTILTMVHGFSHKDHKDGVRNIANEVAKVLESNELTKHKLRIACEALAQMTVLSVSGDIANNALNMIKELGGAE